MTALVRGLLLLLPALAFTPPQPLLGRETETVPQRQRQQPLLQTRRSVRDVARQREPPILPHREAERHWRVDFPGTLPSLPLSVSLSPCLSVSLSLCLSLSLSVSLSLCLSVSLSDSV